MSWQSKVPKSDTKPEMAMRRILEHLRVSFKSQVPIKTRFREWPFIVDFLVENRLVIEVQGVYWHSKKRRSEKDEIKRNCLIETGYQFLEFTDEELKKDPESVETFVRKYLGR
jgi:very-short-patch-repair endonuclease